jgi:hypothetical protein
MFPLLGSRRRSYFALASLITAAAFGGLALLHTYRLIPVVVLAIATVAGGTLRGVLLSAFVVASVNRLGNAQRVMSFQQLVPLVLTAAFAGQLGGYVTEHWSYPAAFGAAAFVSLAFLGLVPLIPEPGPVGVGAASTPSTGTRAERRAHHGADRAVRVAALRAALSNRGLWAVIAFVAYFGFVPSPETARPYFFADALHLSKSLIGQLDSWRAAGSLLGIALYQFVPRDARLRWLAAFVAITNVFYYVPQLVMRDALSAKMVMLLCGALTASNGVAYSCLLARACARGVEATVFGLLASAGTFFYLICDWIGTHLYDWFGPVSHHSVAYGWNMATAICLAFSIPLLFFLPFLPRTDPADDGAVASVDAL